MKAWWRLWRSWKAFEVAQRAFHRHQLRCVTCLRGVGHCEAGQELLDSYDDTHAAFLAALLAVY